MNRDLTSAESVTLEGLIDATSLQAVMQALSVICGEKAEHVRASYDDTALARAWDHAGGVVGVASCGLETVKPGFGLPSRTPGISC